MSKKSKIRAALGGLLALTLVVTCVAVYQSGSKSTPNEKEFVKENEEDSVDKAMKTEEREETEEETEDVDTSSVEGKKKIEEEDTQEKPAEEKKAAEVPTEEDIKSTANTSVQAVPAPDMNFTESSLMEWPVNGQVLIDYNMENTVYFPTLNVYKLNPAIAISSEVGTPVAAVANGKIVSITENEETGVTVTVDMGNGYQAVYGQLKDVSLKEDDYVSVGGVLGYINEPTKYYTKEGANLYFALEKDGTPLDPMQYLP